MRNTSQRVSTSGPTRVGFLTPPQPGQRASIGLRRQDALLHLTGTKRTLYFLSCLISGSGASATHQPGGSISAGQRVRQEVWWGWKTASSSPVISLIASLPTFLSVAWPAAISRQRPACKYRMVAGFTRRRGKPHNPGAGRIILRCYLISTPIMSGNQTTFSG